MQTIVITGGSSGIGLATVRLFAAKGWQVFALSRHAVPLPDGAQHVCCDVTDEAACRDAIATVLRRVEHIDVLISNAGFGISGAIEFTATADAKRLFDVNFFGALNITKAVLPTMRAARRGRIIYTSSVAAPLSIPYQAFYSASKAALNDMALALQNEVRSFGISVCCLLPGDVRTGFTAAREKSIAGSEVYPNIEKAVAAMERDEEQGLSPDEMARCFWRIAQRRHVRPFYVGGFLYRIFYLLEAILPKRLSNRIVGMLYS